MQGSLKAPGFLPTRDLVSVAVVAAAVAFFPFVFAVAAVVAVVVGGSGSSSGSTSRSRSSSFFVTHMAVVVVVVVVDCYFLWQDMLTSLPRARFAEAASAQAHDVWSRDVESLGSAV